MKKALVMGNTQIVIYNFRKETVQKLLDEGFDVTLSIPYGDKVEYFIDKGCKFIDTKIDRRGTNPIKDFGLFIRYLHMMYKLKPDVVLSYTVKCNVYGALAAKLLHIPCIANITGLGSSLENGGLLSKFSTFLYKIALSKASCVFLQNEGNKKFFEKNNIATKAHRLIPGSGVNLNDFSSAEYPRDGDINFLFSGRVMREKGIDEFFAAAETLKKKYPNVNFHIIGFCEENYTPRLKCLQENGTIIYHGFQSDVRSFLEKSNAIVLPSYHEGMANGLLEAAALARPIIASDVYGCRETVDDGVTGFLCKVKDADSLTEALEKFIRLPYEKKVEMGRLGRKKIENEFNRQIVVSAYMEEINKSLSSEKMLEGEQSSTTRTA